MPGHCELGKVREGNAARGAHDAISPGSCRVGVHQPHSPRGGGPWRLALATEALVPPESLGSISSDQKYLKKKKIFQKVDP